MPAQAARQWLAPEEIELQDVEREMERELIQQHAHADRVIAHRMEPDGTIRYLVKVGFRDLLGVYVVMMHTHAHADRVIAHRMEPDGTIRYLVEVGFREIWNVWGQDARALLP